MIASMKACSVDLRGRAVAAVAAEGMSQVAAARRFGLDRSSVGRFVRAWQAGQALEPRQSSGRPKRLRLAEHALALQERACARNPTWNWPRGPNTWRKTKGFA